MAKAKYVNGKDLMLFVDGKAIALATSCTLSISADTLDASNKDDGCWQAQDAGDLSWEATTDALYSADASTEGAGAVYETLFDAMVARKQMGVSFGLPGNAAQDCQGLPEAGWEEPASSATPHYTGKAMVTSLETTGEKGSAATMSVKLTGNGALTKVKAAG